MTKRETSFWGSKSTPDIPGDLMSDALAVAADIIIYANLRGEISDILVNPSNEHLGCLDHWIGRRVTDFLTEESIPKLEHHLARVREEDLGEFRTTELNHVDTASWEFPIKYTILADRENDGVLLVGKDLTPIAEVQQDLVSAQMALERDYEQMRDFETRYRAIMESVKDAVVLVNRNSGMIEDLNLAAAKTLGQDVNTLKGSEFARKFLSGPDSSILDDLIDGAAREERRIITAKIVQNQREVMISFTPMRSAGKKFLLCQLDVEPDAGTATDPLSDKLLSFYENASDAIVITDARGTITSCNAGFLDACDIASEADAVGTALADYLARGSVDIKMLNDNLSQAGQVRSYTTRLNTTFGSSMAVSISLTKLNNGKSVSHAYVLRTNPALNRPSDSGSTVPRDATQNVIKLVGSSPLKEIVAGTADVIEKICIETAVEMTKNNRVAAAEMLGLSRQSLYVKLRKYGLIDTKSDTD